MDANQDPTESLVDSHQADPDLGPDPYQITLLDLDQSQLHPTPDPN